jgi:hypothetical protein
VSNFSIVVRAVSGRNVPNYDLFGDDASDV